MTLLEMLLFSSDDELTTALNQLTKTRRYHIRDLAARLTEEERKARKLWGSKKGGQALFAKLSPEGKKLRAQHAAMRRWRREREG